ncbi:PREDICTED: lamin-like protein [Ipomoea nil]|uniref:lamin-like protein n=1 Tax=Ipomoea nil TaxID=35883 RepID=UPI0009014ABE|nr:PREDICTED: lamin-like protein [Ipomoea nil]
MEKKLRIMALGWPTMAVVLTCAVVAMLPGVSSTRFIVGANMGWTSNMNYTVWARGKHFYLGDWLFFVYDRNQMNVLEVNKTDYESCNADHPLHNWTTGAGRDVVPLNVTKTYYIISGKGFCYGGMKVAVTVEKLPPPPKAAPVKSGSPGLLSTFKGQIVVPALFAIAAVWDSFLLLA